MREREEIGEEEEEGEVGGRNRRREEDFTVRMRPATEVYALQTRPFHFLYSSVYFVFFPLLLTSSIW